MKIELFRVIGLGIAQSGKLFGIPKNKLNLKPGFVIVKNLFGIKINIGGEQQYIARFIRVAGIEEEGKADFALQRDMPEHSGIKGEMGFNGDTCLGVI